MKTQNMKKTTTLTSGLCLAGMVALIGGTAPVALAGIIPYPNSGTENSVTYTFTATASGDLTGYFAGTGASYTEEVGLLDNNVLTSGGYGLNNHSTSVGAAFNFGNVTAGDTLTFVLHVFDTSGYVYSDATENGLYDNDNGTSHNHIYSTDAAVGDAYAGSPAGTYIGFEDLPASGSDWNYFDDTFVFTDVSTYTSVPDSGSSMILLGMALMGIGLLRHRLYA
jgi:hypothetical protein